MNFSGGFLSELENPVNSDREIVKAAIELEEQEDKAWKEKQKAIAKKYYN